MSTRHSELFKKYVDDLKQVKVQVDAWWNHLLEEEESRAGVRQRWPNGPGVHPRVIAVLRQYYFACEELNLQIDRENESRARKREETSPVLALDAGDEEPEEEEMEESVNPSVFLTDGLVTPATEDLATFLAGVTYWPIGLNEQGQLL
jgi:hypothetical protein